MNVQDIRYLYDYTIWANHLTLDATEAVSVEEQMRDRGVSHQSMHGTLLHMLFAEWVWLARWKGVSPSAPLRTEEFPDLASIRNYWQQIEAERADFLANLTDESLQADLMYKDIAGNTHKNPLGLLLQRWRHGLRYLADPECFPNHVRPLRVCYLCHRGCRQWKCNPSMRMPQKWYFDLENRQRKSVGEQC